MLMAAHMMDLGLATSRKDKEQKELMIQELTQASGKTGLSTERGGLTATKAGALRVSLRKVFLTDMGSSHGQMGRDLKGT